MTAVMKSLIWASIIIAIAYVTKEQGMSDNASLGITMGLIGAAVASLGARKSCRLGSC